MHMTTNPVADEIYTALTEHALSLDEQARLQGQSRTIVGWSRPRGADWGWRVDVNADVFFVSAYTKAVAHTRDDALRAATDLFDRIADAVDVAPRGSIGVETVQDIDEKVVGWIGSVYVAAECSIR
jgi:hypothetical protein